MSVAPGAWKVVENEICEIYEHMVKSLPGGYEKTRFKDRALVHMMKERSDLRL